MCGCLRSWRLSIQRLHCGHGTTSDCDCVLASAWALAGVTWARRGRARPGSAHAGIGRSGLICSRPPDTRLSGSNASIRARPRVAEPTGPLPPWSRGMRTCCATARQRPIGRLLANWHAAEWCARRGLPAGSPATAAGRPCEGSSSRLCVVVVARRGRYGPCRESV